MCRTPTTAAPRASSRSSIWWRRRAASSWPRSEARPRGVRAACTGCGGARSCGKPHDFELGGRKALKHAARELKVAAATPEDDVAEIGALPQLFHHRLGGPQPLARQAQLVGIDLPAAAQQPLDRAARPGQTRVAFQQHAADLAPFEQPPHPADDLVLVAIDVD